MKNIFAIVMMSVGMYASTLTLTSRANANYHGPVISTLDSQSVYALCIDYVKYTPIGSTITGSLANVVTVTDMASAVAFSQSLTNIGTPEIAQFYQYVAWEIVNAAGTPDVSVVIGTTTVNSSTVASSLIGQAAANILNTGYTGQFANYRIFVPDVVSNQRFLVTSSQSPSSVPEPTTYAMIGAGLVGLGYFRKKR